MNELSNITEIGNNVVEYISSIKDEYAQITINCQNNRHIFSNREYAIIFLNKKTKNIKKSIKMLKCVYILILIALTILYILSFIDYNYPEIKSVLDLLRYILNCTIVIIGIIQHKKNQQKVFPSIYLNNN
jgi:hypothetical protein